MDFVIAIGTLGAAIAAVAGVMIANQALKETRKIADEQIQVLKQEWRPYLSFVRMSGYLHISHQTGNAESIFIINLANVGKCHLTYKILKLEIFVNGRKPEEQELINQGTVVCAGTSATYRSSSKVLSLYAPNAPEKHNSSECKCSINFEIEYWRADSPEKTYRLKFETFPEFVDEPTKPDNDGNLHSIYGITPGWHGKETFAD